MAVKQERGQFLRKETLEEATKRVDVAPSVNAYRLKFTFEDTANTVDFANGKRVHEGHHCFAGVKDALGGK